MFIISFILELRVVLHCTENHIFFFQTYWKDGISKKIALELDLSCIIGKDYISFSRKYDLTPRRKMKDDLSQKKYSEIWYLVQMFEKMVFSKRIAPVHDLNCTIWKGGTFSRKHGIFSLDRKRERGDLSQEVHGNMIYSIWYVPRLPAKKNQRRSYPSKIHLKMIDIPDRHPRKSSSNSLYLNGDLYRRFHILLSSKKKTKKTQET